MDNAFGFSHLLLSPIAAAAHEKGYDIVSCRSPVSPDKINHLIIPELSLAFISQNSDTFHLQNPYRHIRLDASAEHDIDKYTRRKIRHCRKTYALIMKDAISSLADAKRLHDDLEKIYNPHVDFESIYSLAEHYSEILLK